MKRGRPRIEFDASDKATQEWLNSLTENSRQNYSVLWRKVLAWANMTGDEILASRKTDTDALWEKKVLVLKEYMHAQGASDLYARQATVALRSFFAFYRMELKVTHQEAGRLRQAKRKTEDYRFGKDELRRMYDVGNVEEKYVVGLGKSVGFRAGDFLRLTRGHFDAVELKSEAPIFLGEYATQKEAVRAFPFIDTDAVEAVKSLLEKMTREGRTNPSERMLNYANDSELSRVLRRLAYRAGIVNANKQIRFHCLRKFLCDKLSDVMAESKWKQIVGKTISEGAYVSADNLRADYARAMVETTFTRKASEDEIKFQGAQYALEMQLATSSVPQNVKEELLRRIRASKKMEEIHALEPEVAQALKQQRTEGGGLSFEQQGAASIVRMFELAMKQMARNMNAHDKEEDEQ
jgi:integrase